MTYKSEWALALLAAIYLAVLPMAETIALRSIAMFGVLVILAWRLRTLERGTWAGMGAGWMIPVGLWIAYLCAFPLFAEQPTEAWRSLGQIWHRGILSLMMGVGLALAFAGKNRRGTVFQFGVVTTVPLLIHLVFVGWKLLETGGIPWSYWGREAHHADLGYAAGQAVVLLGVSLTFVQGARRKLALVLIVASVLSLVVAQSRAGLGFALLGLFLVGVVHFLAGHSRARSQKKWVVLIAAGGAIILVSLAAATDARWGRMGQRIVAGFHGDPLQIECEGTAQVEQELVRKYGDNERTADMVIGVQGQDGARVVLFRAGVRLAMEHPWGLDGSRQAFQKRLREHCPEPKIQMAHIHNGWLDTVLAMGWIGAGLYFLVLTNFLRMGVAGLRAGGEGIEWAYVLVVLSIFWILRGFTDSVYRDHQLEMQGFVLAYAAVALKLRSRAKAPAAAGGGA